jgi:hypothetical protein
MAAGQTYVPIATTTLGSAAASYTFSSIPSTYTDLIIIGVGLTTGGSAGSVKFNFNSDTGTNYSETYVKSDGTSATSSRDTNLSGLYATWLDTTQSNFISHIMNYANTTTYKTVLARTNRTGTDVYAAVGLWRNTSAINSIQLTGAGTTLAAGSTFTLYGIAAA